MKLEELKRKKRSVEIPERIKQISDDFNEELSASMHPCKLKDGLFDDPDYNNRLVQQNYLLHYLIAYAFEYKAMYRWILEDMNPGSDFSLRIDSLGCGSTIDYWSMQEVLKESGREYAKACYHGIDAVKWQYYFGKETDSISKTVLIEDAAKYLENCGELEADIYAFPRSICDFNEESFNVMRRAFRYNRIKKDRVYFAFSGIEFSNYEKQSSCQERILNLKRSMEYNSFILENEESYCCPHPEKGITSVDRSLRYPDGVLDADNRLNVKCAKWIDKYFCEECGIYRKPMLTCKHINFLVLKYKRRGNPA